MSKSLQRSVFYLGLVACSIGSAVAGVGNPLQVRLTAIGTKAATDFAGPVEFRLTNTSKLPVRIPIWQTPFAGVDSDLFEISLDGEPVRYQGRMIKRPPPSENDFIELAPGQSRTAKVDLSESYDLRRSGQYVVRYSTMLQFASSGDTQKQLLLADNGGLLEIGSVPLLLWVDGSDQISPLDEALDASAAAAQKAPIGIASVAYEQCSTTRQSQLATAVNSARTYSENAKGYLTGRTGPRYTGWFGAYTSSRYGTVQQNFTKIDDALDNKALVFNCSCTDSYYAYVYAAQPYKIYLCNSFWSAPNTGTDSRAGTLIHEVSHFTVVAGTSDYAYGQGNAKNLAISNPARAIGNADNHEYFAENTPAQN